MNGNDVKKGGFLVHDVESNPAKSKRRLLGKVTGLRWLVAQAMSAKYVHNVVMVNDRLIKIKDLRMGNTANVQSIQGNQAEIVFWAVNRDAAQMQLNPASANRRIVEAALSCGAEGAQLIGLGAYTSIISNGGLTIQGDLEKAGLKVTTGNTYTAVSGVEGLLSLAERVGYDLKESTLTIIGAGGSVGKLAAQLAARRLGKILLVGRKGSDLSEVIALVGKHSSQVSLEQGIRAANLIISVSSTVDALGVNPLWFRSGAILCDIARPRDIGEVIAKSRPDVLVFDGSIIKVPGHLVDLGFNFGFESGTCYGCMAEVLILLLQGEISNFSLGKELDFDKALQIDMWARRHGFALAAYRAFDKLLPETVIENFRKYVKNETMVRGGKKWRGL